MADVRVYTNGTPRVKRVTYQVGRKDPVTRVVQPGDSIHTYTNGAPVRIISTETVE